MTTATTAELIGRRDVARDLRGLALPSGQTYLVHSSLRRVGGLTDGPKTLLDALRDVCGDRSTIVAPAFTADNSTTTRAYRRRTAGMTPEQLLQEEDKITGFDPDRSPSQNMGAFTEYLRNELGAARSDHPQTSFCAIGPRAEEVVAQHELRCHLGEESPLGCLYGNDAIVLLIGVGFEVCTCFHLAEYRLLSPAARRLYRTYVMRDGQRELREFHAPDTEDRDFSRIGRAMRREPFVHVGRVGQARVYWFRLREGVDFAVDWMNRCRLAAPVPQVDVVRSELQAGVRSSAAGSVVWSMSPIALDESTYGYWDSQVPFRTTCP